MAKQGRASKGTVTTTTGPKKKPSQIKVNLRCDTLALVSTWLDSTFAAEPDQNKVKLSSELQRFYETLIKLGKKANNGTRRLDFDREFATRLVNAALSFFAREHPHLLLQRSDYGPGNGLAAMAEIMLAIKAALDRGEGRPRAADPIEAHEANERVKRTRDRANYKPGAKYRESEPAHVVAAKKLGVSKNTLNSAVAEGRIVASVIAEAKASLPSDAEPLFALVNYDAKTVELIAGKKPR